MQLPRPSLLVLPALALALAFTQACTHGAEPPAAVPETPAQQPASTPPATAADGPAAATDAAQTPSDAEPEVKDEDCALAKVGQPCRAPYQHCPQDCHDSCQPCTLLVCEDGAWNRIEEFPEPGCNDR